MNISNIIVNMPSYRDIHDLSELNPIEEIQEAIYQHPDTAIVGAKTGLVTGLGLTLLPVNAAIKNYAVLSMPLREAFVKISKQPFVGAKDIVYGDTAKLLAVFQTKQFVEKGMIHNGFSEKQADEIANYPASLVGAAADFPFKKRRTRLQLQQNTDFKIIGGHGVFRGLGLGVMKNMSKWGVGFAVGNRINDEAKVWMGDTFPAKLGSKTLGWAIGGFFGNPFSLLQTHIMGDESLKSTKDALVKIKVLYDPNSYHADNYKVNNVAARFVLGMPLDPSKQECIAKESLMSLRVFHAVTHGPALWRATLISLPLTLLSGATIVLAEEGAKRLLKQ